MLTLLRVPFLEGDAPLAHASLEPTALGTSEEAESKSAGRALP